MAQRHNGKVIVKSHTLPLFMQRQLEDKELMKTIANSHMLAYKIKWVKLAYARVLDILP